jgi:hypothetical protein
VGGAQCPKTRGLNRSAVPGSQKGIAGAVTTHPEGGAMVPSWSTFQQQERGRLVGSQRWGTATFLFCGRPASKSLAVLAPPVSPVPLVTIQQAPPGWLDAMLRRDMHCCPSTHRGGRGHSGNLKRKGIRAPAALRLFQKGSSQLTRTHPEKGIRLDNAASKLWHFHYSPPLRCAIFARCSMLPSLAVPGGTPPQPCCTPVAKLFQKELHHGELLNTASRPRRTSMRGIIVTALVERVGCFLLPFSRRHRNSSTKPLTYYGRG